jgi:hypothetical protein
MELDLTTYPPADRERIAKAIAKAVSASYLSHPFRANDRETRRRMMLCFKLFNDMVLGLSWTLTRFEDCIVECLKRELNGQTLADFKFRDSWTTNTKKELVAKDEYELNSSGILVPRSM